MVAVTSLGTLRDRLTTKLSRGQAAQRVGRRLERWVRRPPVPAPPVLAESHQYSEALT